MLPVILTCVAAGFAFGLFAIPPALVPYLDTVTTGSLAVLLVLIGIDLGRGRVLLQIARRGPAVLALPLLSGLGSLVGAGLVHQLVKLPLNQALAVGAGFGWYSLSGVLIAEAGFPELGGLAFLANVIRELLAIVLIPLLAARLGPLCAIAPGGATTMDTTLPLIARAAGEEAAVPALVHGMVLSMAVPFLVSLLIHC